MAAAMAMALGALESRALGLSPPGAARGAPSAGRTHEAVAATRSPTTTVAQTAQSLAGGLERLTMETTTLAGGGATIQAGARQLEVGLTLGSQDASGVAIPAALRIVDRLREAADDVSELGRPTARAQGRSTEAFRRLSRETIGKADPTYVRVISAVGLASAALSGEDPRNGRQVEPGYHGLKEALTDAEDRLRDGADLIDERVKGGQGFVAGPQRSLAELEALLPPLGRLSDDGAALAGDARLLRRRAQGLVNDVQGLGLASTSRPLTDQDRARLRRANLAARSLAIGLRQANARARALGSVALASRPPAQQLVVGLTFGFRDVTGDAVPETERLLDGLRSGVEDADLLREPVQLAEDGLQRALRLLRQQTIGKLDPQYPRVVRAVRSALAEVIRNNREGDRRRRASHRGLDAGLVAGQNELQNATQDAKVLVDSARGAELGVTQSVVGASELPVALERLAAAAATIAPAIGRLRGSAERLGAALSSIRS